MGGRRCQDSASRWNQSPLHSVRILVISLQSHIFSCSPSGKKFDIRLKSKDLEMEEYQSWLDGEGTVISFKHRGINASGSPKLPKFHRIHPHKSWQWIVQNHFPYQLSPVEKVGTFTVCRGCKMPIKSKYKIVVRGTLSKDCQYSRDSKQGFCLDSNCIRNGIAEGILISTRYPKFDNNIFLPYSLQLEMEEEGEDISKLEINGMKLTREVLQDNSYDRIMEDDTSKK
jgi:hypothetical protein